MPDGNRQDEAAACDRPGGQRDELLARLLHVGCVEVTEPEDCLTDPEWTALQAKDTGAQGCGEGTDHGGAELH